MKTNEDNNNVSKICTFNESLSVFDVSLQDLSRTTHRMKIYPYSKGANLPVLYRHYKHYHDDEVSISGYRTKSQDYYTLFIFVDGKIGLFSSDKLYTSGFGKVVTLNPHNDYTLFIYTLENLEYYEFDFPIEFLKSIPTESPFHKLFSDKKFSGLMLKENETEKLFRILNKIDTVVDSGEEYAQFAAYSHLMEAAILICNGISQNSVQNPKLNPIVKNAFKYISDNLLTLSDTKEIAKHCNVSVSYLCRMFKKHLDTTPLEYKNNQKLLRAKYLLKNGSNVTEACYESGFDSYNYFITKFRNLAGMTPTEYQKSEGKE